MLSIFNNGSGAWIVLILLVIWVVGFSIRAYRNHKSGYHKQIPSGEWIDQKPNLLSNGAFIFLIIGAIALTAFLLWINSEYR